MDQNALVADGHALLRALDHSGLRTKLAMWVHDTDADSWKLWLVPQDRLTDRISFYRDVSEQIAKHRSEMLGMESSDTKFVSDDHPAIIGLRSYVRAPGLEAIRFPGNLFNGYYLPEGIILRSDL